MKKRSCTSVCILALIFCLVFTACGSSTEKAPVSSSDTSNVPATRQFVDSVGRTVKVPTKINKVQVISPVGQIAVYTMDPDKLAGWVYEFNEKETKFINEKYLSLPVLGGTYGGGNVLNPEVVVKTAPDVLLDIGQLSDASAANADKLQKQTGVPVVVIALDADLQGTNNAPKMYRMLGDLLNEKERAEELAAYCQKVLDDVKAKAATIKEEDKVSVYYAEGTNGLLTEPPASSHAQVLNVVGAKNVADVPVGAKAGKSEVSMEQVIKWNPEVMIISPESSAGKELGEFYTALENNKDPKWRQIQAVKNGKYYLCPSSPFNWFDRPPSVNRIIGIMWCGNLLYPDVYDYDMVKETKDFYKLFYHVDLTDKDVQSLLGASTLKNSK